MVKIQIILGSTRPKRISEKFGAWVYAALQKHQDVEVELIDLRDYPLPFYNEPTGIQTLKEYSTPVAPKWADKIATGDGFIFITPEYNHGYPAVLKNALDYLYFQWNKKPAGFVSYGGMAAGSRSVEQLRQVAMELKMVPIEPSVNIVWARQAFDEKGKITNPLYEQSLEQLFTELIWWAKLLKKARNNEIKL